MPRPTQTIDLVYPWKKTSFDELKFSIRSAVRSFRDLRQCWVYSPDAPSIQAPYVTWERSDNRGRHADEIILNCLMRACDNPRISDPFVYSCDDYYWLQDTGLTELSAVIALENLDVRKPYQGRDPWKKRLWATLFQLEALGYTTYNYCTHTPILIYKDQLRRAVTVLGTDVQLESAYFNICWNRTPDAFISQLEWKGGLYSPQSAAEIIAQVAGKRFLSHNDEGLNQTLRQAIQLMFPEERRRGAAPAR
ncbi:MAG: hypothetical protein ACI8RZ_000708 [Myxococcota bacterium]|jgi:hypothetical protein